GRRVLLVDLDPQGSATVSLGFQKSKLLYTVYDALAQSRKIEEVMLGTKVENLDRKSTRLNSSHVSISYAVFCLKKKIFFSGVLGEQRGAVKRFNALRHLQRRIGGEPPKPLDRLRRARFAPNTHLNRCSSDAEVG